MVVNILEKSLFILTIKKRIPLFFNVPISLDQNSTKSIFCADERMNDYGKRKKHCNEAMLSTWGFCQPYYIKNKAYNSTNKENIGY